MLQVEALTFFIKKARVLIVPSQSSAVRRCSMFGSFDLDCSFQKGKSGSVARETRPIEFYKQWEGTHRRVAGSVDPLNARWLASGGGLKGLAGRSSGGGGRPEFGFGPQHTGPTLRQCVQSGTIEMPGLSVT